MKKFYEYSKLKDIFKNENLLEQLYNITKEIEKDYPEHYNWFHNKFCKELDGKKREIIFCVMDNLLVAVAFLKKCEKEKKICTIYVDKNYRNLGIGTELLLESFSFLGTTQPLITMPDYKVIEFQKIIKKYNWKKREEIKGYYSNNLEVVYNGYLNKKVIY